MICIIALSAATLSAQPSTIDGTPVGLADCRNPAHYSSCARMPIHEWQEVLQSGAGHRRLMWGHYALQGSPGVGSTCIVGVLPR